MAENAAVYFLTATATAEDMKVGTLYLLGKPQKIKEQKFVHLAISVECRKKASLINKFNLFLAKIACELLAVRDDLQMNICVYRGRETFLVKSFCYVLD